MKYFDLQEMVDRTTYLQWGNDAWLLFNPDLLESVDGIREYFGVPCWVNDWWDGHGQNQYRGYRPQNCPIGAEFSEHKKGNATDMTISGVSAEEARQEIRKNKDHPLLCKIMRMEKGTPWLHIDCGVPPQGKDRIYLFTA